MNVFDQKLRAKVHEYKSLHDLKLYEIADLADIERNEFYQFSAGQRPLNGERVKKLLDALNLTIEIK